MKVFLIMAIFIVSLASCGGGDDGGGNSGAGNVPQRLWGEWYSIDTGNSQLLNNKTVFEYTEIMPSLLKVITSRYGAQDIDYLIRSGGNNAQITGNINKPSNQASPAKTSVNVTNYATSGIGGIGGINVILGNVNTGESERVQTDSNGEFVAANLPTGEYTIVAEDSSDNTDVAATIKIDNGINNLGTYNLTKKNTYNFKSEAIFNKPFLFGDNTVYQGSIRVNNIGSEVATGLGFNVVCADPAIQSCVLGNATGTVSPGGYKDIPVTIQFKYLNTVSQNIEIPITITDGFGKQWNDSVFITVYKTRLNINLTSGVSSENLTGFFISENNKLVRVRAYGSMYSSEQLAVPYIPNETFKLVFAAILLRNEMPYSIGLNVPSSTMSELSFFSDTSNFEPNNIESESASLSIGAVIDSYIHVSDIDYFKISLPGNGLPSEAVILNVDEISALRDSDTTFYGRDGSVYNTNGNGNGILNAGETAAFEFSVKNSGTSKVENVVVSISTTDTYISLAEGLDDNMFNQTISSLNVDEIKDLDGFRPSSIYYLNYGDDFSITADSSTPANHQAIIDVKMQDAFGNVWNDSFTVAVE